MMNKTVAEYASEIQKTEDQISELNKQQEENKVKITAEGSTFDQLQKEKEDLLKKIESIGFFEFKEKKSHKTKLKETQTKIENQETILSGLKERNKNLSKQVDGLRNQLIPIRQAKEKEEKWQEDIRTGKVDPGKAKEIASVGVTLMQAGKNAEALEQFANAIKYNPRFKEAYYGRIDIHRSMKNWDAVIADCKMALEIDKDDRSHNEKISCMLGSAYNAKDDSDSAYRVLQGLSWGLKNSDLDKLIKIEAYIDFGIASYNLAVKKGDDVRFVGAKEAFQNALDMDPNNAVARELIAMIPTYIKTNRDYGRY